MLQDHARSEVCVVDFDWQCGLTNSLQLFLLRKKGPFDQLTQFNSLLVLYVLETGKVLHNF
jgi:hypothetical protein